LIIRQPNVAARKIDDIGYERLRGYFLSRRDLTRPGRPFFDGTTYQDVIELYQCDAALRHAIFPVVGQFEVLLRNSISEALSGSYGSHPYFSAEAFRDAASCLDYLLRARGFPSAVEEMARGKLVRATAARLSEAGF
jgi:abortive infection bacteriophage resistance protein